MSLNQWVDNGWLRRHKTSQEEIKNLVMIIDRDLKDAKGGISDDWRFGIAYNAALKLCTILIYAEGFKAEKTLQHYRTIQALPLILGKERNADAVYTWIHADPKEISWNMTMLEALQDMMLMNLLSL